MLIRLVAGAIASDEPLGAPGTVSISDKTSTGPSGLTAGIGFSNTGGFIKYFYGTPVQISDWLTPATNMGDYEVRATLNSGDTPDVGTIGSWEALSTTREWTLAATVSTLECELLIEIRWTGNNVVQDSATYTLSATAGTPGGGNNPPDPV
jgi:hypothetical protein